MRTFLVLVFCLLVVDNGNAVLEMPKVGVENTGVAFRKTLPLPIYCNWIVVMQRLNESLDFNRNWAEYRNGFGELERGEFWLGNEVVHRLTNGDVYSLRIEVFTYESWYYADYATFSLESEDSKYALRVSGFSGGTAGDSLTNTSVASYWYHGGMRFSASGADNDAAPKNCAREYQAGWWFNGCWHSCLTCKSWKDFQWESLSYLKSKGILQGARMMIKRQMNKT